MDELDRKILYEISENARESHNVLARKLRCSREVFDYRLKKFQDQRIINTYQARINISNFIYGGYILLIQTINLSKKSEKLILNKVKSNQKTQFIGNIGGEYDLIIGFTTKNINDLYDYINFINSCFGKSKSKSLLLTMVKEIKDSYKSLFSSSEEPNNIVSMPIISIKIKIDDIDKKILIALGNDATLASWKIADKTKISEVAIRKRISKLIDSKLILGFRAMIDPSKLDYQAHDLFIKVNSKSEKDEIELINLFQSRKDVTYAVRTIGEYDFVIRLLVKNNIELKNYIQELRNKFPDIISNIISQPLFETIYHTQLAESFLE
ncbi:Lrp/AsnC family transcriptional regulator [Candidatus Pacearchaeota archaeon]|nr:Lrp/AsnC family transcriptional regulator [Candidatus Pacearchaeota archaeon]